MTPNIKTKGATDPFYNLTLASGGSLQSAVQATNNLTITAGTLTLNANNLTVGVNLTGGGTLAATASETITVGADFTPTGFTRATSTVVLNTAAAASVSGLSFYNLTINKSAQADTVTSTGALTVTNLLTMTQGTWAAATFTHTIAGAWDSSGATFTFTAGTSTISLSPTVTPNIKTKGATDPFYNLTLASGGSLQSAVQTTNNLTITAGTLTLNAFNLTVGVNLTGAGLTATASEAISVGGSWNIATLTPATSTVTFTGTGGAGPFTVSSNAQSFSTVALNSGAVIYRRPTRPWWGSR